MPGSSSVRNEHQSIGHEGVDVKEASPLARAWRKAMARMPSGAAPRARCDARLSLRNGPIPHSAGQSLHCVPDSVRHVPHTVRSPLPTLLHCKCTPLRMIAIAFLQALSALQCTSTSTPSRVPAHNPGGSFRHELTGIPTPSPSRQRLSALPVGAEVAEPWGQEDLGEMAATGCLLLSLPVSSIAPTKSLPALRL